MTVLRTVKFKGTTGNRVEPGNDPGTVLAVQAIPLCTVVVERVVFDVDGVVRSPGCRLGPGRPSETAADVSLNIEAAIVQRIMIKNSERRSARSPVNHKALVVGGSIGVDEFIVVNTPTAVALYVKPRIPGAHYA